MVQSVLGRTPNKDCPQFTDKEVVLITAGMNANNEFQELALHGFCFLPLAGRKKGQCNCVHKKHLKALKMFSK